MLSSEMISIAITVMIALYILGFISGWTLNEVTQPKPPVEEDDDLDEFDIEEYRRLLK